MFCHNKVQLNVDVEEEVESNDRDGDEFQVSIFDASQLRLVPAEESRSHRSKILLTFIPSKMTSVDQPDRLNIVSSFRSIIEIDHRNVLVGIREKGMPETTISSDIISIFSSFLLVRAHWHRPSQLHREFLQSENESKIQSMRKLKISYFA